MDETAQPSAVTGDFQDPTWRHLRDALRDLRFGTVTLIVQDGVIIQIDRTEKRRLARPQRQTVG